MVRRCHAIDGSVWFERVVLAAIVINIIELSLEPSEAEFIYDGDSAKPLLAVAAASSPALHVFDARSPSNTPLATTESMHRAPITQIKYNRAFHAVVSCDSAGGVEYWSAALPNNQFVVPETVAFKFKSEARDLLTFLRAKKHVLALAVAPDGSKFATLSNDRHVRVFDFKTGLNQVFLCLTLVYTRFLQAN